MARYFQNPANGYVEKGTGGFTWLWALLFGPFYLAYKGAWPHVLVYLLLLLFLSSPRDAGIALLLIHIVYAVCIYPLLRWRYRRKGWIETEADGTAINRMREPAAARRMMERLDP